MVYTDKNKYFEYLIQEYSDMVYRLAVSRTRNKEISEDVYQEVFLKIAKKLPEFESKDHEKAWLIRVTINCSNTILGNKFDKHNLALEKYIQNVDDNHDYSEMNNKNEIYYAVLQLPLKYRTVIHLFYYEGYKIEEISRILKINENTVKSQLSRAREKLKTRLKGGFEDE